MPAAKRSAPKETKVTERAKKASKKEADAASPAKKEVEQTKDEFQKECEAILALLHEDGVSMHESAKDMLLVAAPFALKPSKAERHEFQDQTVNMLQSLFDGVKVRNTEAVKVFETQAAEAATEQRNLQQALEDAQGKETEAKDARDAAEKALEESNKILSNVKKDSEESNKQLEAFKAEKQKFIEEKAQRDDFISSTWMKLKEVELKGADLRARNKQLMSILTSLDVEESLKLALPVALKLKPDQRGKIGLNAIEIADDVLQRSLVDMVAKLDEKDSEIEKQNALVAEKTSAIDTARTGVEEKQNGLITTENSLMHAKEEITQKKADLQNAEITSKSVQENLGAATEKLQEISSLLERFNAIVNGGEFATKPKEEKPMEVEAPADLAEEHATESALDKTQEATAEVA